MEPCRPTQAFVDLDAIRHNLGIVRQCVGSTCRIAAVVKADGYGHGSVQVARAVLAAGAEALCVAIPCEAVELREHFPAVQIIVFNPVFPSEVETVVHYDLTQTVDDADILPHLDRAAALYGKEVQVHLKIDTGMARIGLRPGEAPGFARQVARCRHVRVRGVYSHFATADEGDQAFARQQLAAFQEAVDTLRAHGCEAEIRHMANSAAILSLPESHMDMVRPGIMIYGLRPAEHLGAGLRPAMTVMSRIAKLKMAPAGTAISYGGTWRCPGPRNIATIPMGYADGYRRGLSNRFYVLVGGTKAPVVGRVCMDMFMADVSEVAGVRKGDDVIIFGVRGKDHLPAEEMADVLETIPYEIVTGISGRVPRVYGQHRPATM